MPDKLAHHARVGHDRSVHQMLRNEGRLRRCRKRDIVLHRTPLAVAREKLDDGAHAVATVAVPLNHGRRWQVVSGTQDLVHVETAD